MLYYIGGNPKAFTYSRLSAWLQMNTDPDTHSHVLEWASQAKCREGYPNHQIPIRAVSEYCHGVDNWEADVLGAATLPDDELQVYFTWRDQLIESLAINLHEAPAFDAPTRGRLLKMAMEYGTAYIKDVTKHRGDPCASPMVPASEDAPVSHSHENDDTPNPT